MAQKLLGEKIIQSVLEKLGLSYSTKVKLSHLVLDPKKYRQPDFYLPDYRLYIEYFSTWDAKMLKEKERAKCLEKQRIYIANNMEVLYIYPKDLPRAETLIKQRIKTLMERKLPNEPVNPFTLPKNAPLLLPVPKKKEKKKPQKKIKAKIVEVVKEITVKEKSLEDVAKETKNYSPPTKREEPRIVHEKPETKSTPLNFTEIIETFGGAIGVLIILEIIAIIILAIIYFFFR